MRIDILTLFPGMFKGPFDESIIKRAQKKGFAEINIHDLRNWTNDKRKTVDDKPYGGGAGMVMMVEPIDRALTELNTKYQIPNTKIILTSPRGKKFNQKKAQELSKLDHLIFICGHYEGLDERISEHLINEEISIGDYVLTGGELPTMIMIDTIVRLIPGVLEKSDATKFESFSNLETNDRESTTNNLLEYPQYTRPEDYKGWKVPEILLSGDHKKIAEWRKEKARKLTQKRRPEFFR